MVRIPEKFDVFLGVYRSVRTSTSIKSNLLLRRWIYVDPIVIEPIHWIGSEVDFHRKSNYYGPSYGTQGERRRGNALEGRLSQSSNLTPIPTDADKLIYP